jgi:hypothetical protein
LSYPSSEDRDTQADPDLALGKSGHWHGLTPLAQAEWAETYSALALVKGNVVGAFWMANAWSATRLRATAVFQDAIPTE